MSDLTPVDESTTRLPPKHPGRAPNPNGERRAGRPSKFTPEVREKVIQALRNGNYRSVAARYAGISEGTLHKYLNAALHPDADPEYVAFRNAVEKAEADAEVADLALIRRSAQDQMIPVRDSDGTVVRDAEGNPVMEVAQRGSWQAAAWIRERKNPERWGRRERQQIEVSGPDGGPIQVGGVVQLDTEGISNLAATLARRAEIGDGSDIVDAEVIED